MGRIILKINEYYLEWSTIVDAPITFGMRLDEFEAYHRDEYGANGHRDFGQRIARIEKTGTSSHYGATLADVIAANKAGPNETKLTLDEIYQAYCLQNPIKDGWVVPI